MKTTEEKKMKRSRFIWVFVGMLVLLVMTTFSGCVTGTIGEGPEEQTPTGCWKHKGRYYDPMVGECVQATSKEQMFFLDAYRYTHQLADEGKLSEAEYDIYFKRYMTIEEVEPLWAELRERGASMIQVASVLPNDRVFDPMPGFENNEKNPPVNVWGGPSVAQGCGWWKREDSPAPTIKDMVIEHIKREELEREQPLNQVRQAVLEDNLCRIYAIDIMADPKIMPDFWDRHFDEINGIRPEVNTIDFVMPGFHPEALTEER